MQPQDYKQVQRIEWLRAIARNVDLGRQLRTIRLPAHEDRRDPGQVRPCSGEHIRRLHVTALVILSERIRLYRSIGQSCNGGPSSSHAARRVAVRLQQVDTYAADV